MAQIRSKPFGVTKEGANVTEYTLSNPGGLSVSVLDYGCVIKNIIVPAKNGPVDVVIGHDTMADYEADFLSPSSTCCGAFVGRYANRIENAEFSVGGATYKLEANNGPNHLHGGTKNFANRLWESRVETNRVVMSLLSEDGDQNYPGELNVEAVFDFDDEHEAVPVIPREAQAAAVKPGPISFDGTDTLVLPSDAQPKHFGLDRPDLRERKRKRIFIALCLSLIHI